MSQLSDVRESAQTIQAGLRRLGKNRSVALSVHVTKDVIDDLEQQVADLVEKLEMMDK